MIFTTLLIVPEEKMTKKKTRFKLFPGIFIVQETTLPLNRSFAADEWEMFFSCTQIGSLPHHKFFNKEQSY